MAENPAALQSKKAAHPHATAGGTDCVQASRLTLAAKVHGAGVASCVHMITGKDIVKITALATGAFVVKSTLSRLFEYDLKNKTVLIAGGSRGLGLRAELMKDGISVTTVCPGLMRTGSPRNAEFKGKHRYEYAWFSISDALPLLTVSAENAARQIVRACNRGQAELIISVPAKLAVLFDSLFPEMMSQMLGLANQLLPAPGGVGTQSMKGRESTSAWSPSWLTTLNEEAALRNNEVRH